MLYKMKVNQLTTVITLSSVILYYSVAIDMCRDTDNVDCQSCGNTDYPRDEFYRQNCMRSCDVCTGTNIALGKPTAQSTTYFDSRSSSSKAVDGSTGNNWSSGQCTHTNENTVGGWWCVDLQQIYKIDTIKLFNRDKYEDRLQGFEIKISSSGTCNQTGLSSATSCYKDTPPTIQDIYTIDRCNQPTSTSISAKTVYVTIASSQPLTLCEVQIFSDTLTNVALRQQLVQQSSTRYGAVASRAVDGNTNSDWSNGSCTHTIEGYSGWWCVDLQQLYYFNQIKIYNRQNTSFWGRLQGFEIKTSSSGQCSEEGLQSATSCYKDTTSTQSVYTVTGCNQPSSTSFSGRTAYVKSFNNALVMCEVEIFADLAQCNTGYYSTSRSTCQPCNTCSNNRCDPTTGVCTGGCKTGFYGTKCQQSCNTCHDDRCDSTEGVCTGGCKTGFYGTKCQQSCNTCHDDSCDSTTGVCTGGCKTGFYGTKCQQNCNTCHDDSCDSTTGVCSGGCKTGFYGTKCQQNCNTCHDDSCDSTTGVCSGDCKTGFYGTKCQQSCNTCHDDSCDSTAGVCTGDCKTGFYGTKCQQNCSDGCLNNQCSKSDGRCNDCKPDTVGPYCNLTCGTECQPRTDQTSVTCDRNGRCTECTVGRYGDRCDTNCNTGCTVCDRDDANSCTECKDGRWGSSCNKLCNTNCKPVVCTTVGKCDQMTGDCINGCVPGKIGSNCTTDCEAGRYGDNCTSKCGNCADETPCDAITGSCGLGCADGFQGPACKEPLPALSSITLSPVVIGVIGVLVGVLCGILGSVAVFLSYHFYKKRRQSNNSNTDLNPTTSTTDDTLTTRYQNIPTNTRNLEYGNPTSSTTDDTLTTVNQNIPTNTRNVDFVNLSFNTEDNTRNMYDTLELTPDNTQQIYTTLGSYKPN
ncbi:multiple epidermal growth factor-like domains protein 10 [Patella vulgata]|uniref:multiple epidermal growth factor-like domains protein 10 n=1 Tax=Patella vulgata TaxID=6465 RepID=UPI00217FEA4C|nr:multiple epidermal growth factor-like domains protein 10 [Patella vulgata]